MDQFGKYGPLRDDDRFLKRWFIFCAVLVVLVWCGLGWAVYELVRWVTAQ